MAESEKQSPQSSTFFVDTNIFLEVVFEDARWEECRAFLKKVEASKKRKPESKIETFLAVISSVKGLSISRPEIDEMSDAVRSMAKRKLDFDDSFVVSTMIANKVTRLDSFDRHFDGVKEIKRLEPVQVLDAQNSQVC